MRVSNFGLGYVGAVSAACLAELGHEVIGVDVNPLKTDMINAGRSPIIEDRISELTERAVAAGRLRATTDGAAAVAASDRSLVAVGTPSAGNGAPLLTAVDAVVGEIGRALRDKPSAHAVVIRSTVPPGTTDERFTPILVQQSGRRPGGGLEIGFNPEFLREGSSVKDFYHPPFTVIGAATPRGTAAIEALYAGLEAPVIRTTCRVAESVKYLSNAFHALKITFANEAGALLKSCGVDSRAAMDIFCRDQALNISPAYLRPGFAFGGSCLPKDLRALLALARGREVELPMLGQILASNLAQIERAFELVTRHGRRRIALFGLAFKPGTDDLRESPLVTLAERLIGKGYELVIFDPFVEASRLIGTNRDFIQQQIPHFERLMVTIPEAALEAAEILLVGHAQPAALEAIAAVAGDRNRRVIDLQGLPRLEILFGDRYEGICW